MSRVSRWLAAFALIVIVCLVALPLYDAARTAAVLVRAVGLQGRAASIVGRVASHTVSTSDLRIETRKGHVIRARLYAPDTAWRRTIVLVPGVHAVGLDEPRLVSFGSALAAGGYGVLAVELPDLLRYRITPALADQLEDVIAWASRQPRLARDGRVGVLGISFAGGIAVATAGRPAIRDRIAFVTALGGHGDLRRTLQYLSTGVRSDGHYVAQHDYGLVVVLLNLLQDVVPADQVLPLDTGIRRFMQASHDAMTDQVRAAVVYGEAVAMEQDLPQPARSLLHAVNTRDVATLGRIVTPLVATVTIPDGVSPLAADPPAAPVYLFHGANDNVVPSLESVDLASTLRARGARVTLHVSTLVTHAEMDHPPTISDVWAIVWFWTKMLSH